MDDDKYKEQIQKKMEQLIEGIIQHAIELYDLMEPGAVIEITFPEMNTVIIPNKPSKMRRLIIIRPYMHFQIQSKLKQERV